MNFEFSSEFQGLDFKKNFQFDSDIIAVIGRNGVGKTRFLKAIKEGHIRASMNGDLIPQNEIKYFSLGDFNPQLTFNFDAIKHRDLQTQAIEIYRTYKGKFDVNPQQSMAAINYAPQSMTGFGRVNVGIDLVSHIASSACQFLGKDVNSLDDVDIKDFYFDSMLMTIGSLNVTALMRIYLDRQLENDNNGLRNQHRGERNEFLKDAEFKARFGLPPWDIFNEYLKDFFNGGYYINIPTPENRSTYTANLYRVNDDKLINTEWLSSGEKILMWLCLVMYTSQARFKTPLPKLLLLDEPDGALHPEMIQKLHRVLKTISTSFDAGIIFTTHSPTTVALFDAGPILQVSEDSLIETAQDAAIRDLLVGLDQISINYTKCIPVFVESHKDADIYEELFRGLRYWDKKASPHIALKFIPAAPKLASENVKNLIKAHLNINDETSINAFVTAFNGQGDCVKVIGAVESLTNESGASAHGIIDWDLKNKNLPYVQVLGEGVFYNIESVILNPLTFGLYLLHTFPEKISIKEYGISKDDDISALFSRTEKWQGIADGVMKHLLKVYAITHDMPCIFFGGCTINFDKRYTQMNGHDLEALIKNNEGYPFLNEFKSSKRTTLLKEVVEKSIKFSHGRTMPMNIVELFQSIQDAI